MTIPPLVEVPFYARKLSLINHTFNYLRIFLLIYIQKDTTKIHKAKAPEQRYFAD